jgi:hypothetical protein
MARAPRKGGRKAAPRKSAPRQRDYAAEYARRVGNLPKGQRSAARGHGGPGEAARRLAREREAGGLTSRDRAFVRRTARQMVYSGKLGPDADEDDEIEMALEWAAAVGIDKFKAELADVRDRIRRYQEGDLVKGRYERAFSEYEWKSAQGEGFPNPAWYYYAINA